MIRSLSLLTVFAISLLAAPKPAVSVVPMPECGDACPYVVPMPECGDACPYVVPMPECGDACPYGK